MSRGVASVARDEPGRTALVAGDQRVTFAQLDSDSNRWAQVFSEAGVGHGDRVAVMLRNRPELFACWLGAARLGALVVPLSYRYTSPEATYIVVDSGATAFVHEDPDVAAAVIGAAPSLRAAVNVDEGDWRRAPAKPPTEDFLGTPTIFMNYTSGTTGRPKGIARPLPSPGPIDMPPQAFTELWGWGADDVHLLCGPAYHTAPGNYALSHLYEGARVVIMERFDADTCLELIEGERVTTSHMVPANFIRILDTAWQERDLTSVRKIIHAAAPCPIPVKRRIMEVFPAGSVWEYFGMSEGFVSLISPEEWMAKPGSVGKPIPGLTVRILDEEGRDLPVGEVGFIYVSALPGFHFEYHGDPGKSAATWRGDFYTVGDMGRLDDDGYLYVADRRVDLIIRGGVNIYPAEVETALAEHPSVLDSAVFGLPDPALGQRVHAVIERRPGTSDTEADLVEFLRRRLASFKLPSEIEFVTELPREPNGKVLKRQLREARMQAEGPDASPGAHPGH